MIGKCRAVHGMMTARIGFDIEEEDLLD